MSKCHKNCPGYACIKSGPKHTVGPLEYQAMGEANEYLTTTDNNRWVHSIRQNGELSLEKQEANMRLVTAAPDLYQHVTEYLELCEKMKDAKDSEERADYLSIMVGLKSEMKRTIDKVNGNG